MKIANSILLISLLQVLMVVGCAHKPAVNTISNAYQEADIQRVEDRRVIKDKALAKALRLMEVRESKTNDGFKRIQIFLKNYNKEPFTFSYRFNWYDENGVEVEAQDDEAWKKVHAMSGDDVTLTSIAPTINCADFKVRIISRH